MSARSATVNLIKQIVQHSTNSGFPKIFNNIKYVRHSTNRVVCEMQVLESHSNSLNTLHGGATASLVDVVSTWVLTAESGKAGISMDMNISYMRPAKVGEDILIDAQILKVGKSTAFLSVDITNKADGGLIAQGRHTKNISKI